MVQTKRKRKEFTQTEKGVQGYIYIYIYIGRRERKGVQINRKKVFDSER